MVVFSYHISNFAFVVFLYILCSHLEFTGVQLVNWPKSLHRLSKLDLHFVVLHLIYFSFLFPDAVHFFCESLLPGSFYGCNTVHYSASMAFTFLSNFNLFSA